MICTEKGVCMYETQRELVRLGIIEVEKRDFEIERLSEELAECREVIAEYEAKLEKLGEL
jgi:predicted transcriptional regulator with HTH domain